MSDHKVNTLRNVCFTCNNYTDEEYNSIIEHITDGTVKYAVVGKEVGESGTPHLQGYIEYHSSRSWKLIKKRLFNSHIEKRKGTAMEAASYCKKEDDEYYEFGTISNQGKRNDLDEIKKLIDAGESMALVADKHFGSYIRYNKGFDKYINLKTKHRTEPPYVQWSSGLAGTGKTFEAVETSMGDYYIKDNSIWWDGYTNQNTIIIDDFDLHKWEFRTLLALLDRYKYQGQIKGGYVTINSPRIIITCEFPLNHLWVEGTNAYQQVRRRINCLKDFDQIQAEVTPVILAESK